MLAEVKVDRAKLLETLKNNRGAHVDEYEEAVQQYRVEAEKALRKRAIEIRDEKTLRTSIDLPEPVSFSEEYDRAIAMVEWSEEEQITLDEQDFRSFVLDEWTWRGRFAAMTSTYNNRG